jgi:tRNA/rRNA methyltransferase
MVADASERDQRPRAPLDLARITFVLDKVRHPDNLGSALRALKNSGLTRIALADPYTHEFDRARRMATDAEDLLDHLEVTKDLAAAVAGATLVAGTTSRRPQGRPTLWLRGFVARASAETDAGGEVALVFGNEQRGLSDEELDLCQVVVNIPSAPEKPSINLAQAVMLAAHECYLASLAPPAPALRPPPASAGLLHALYARMRAALLEADFLNEQNPDAILSELKRLLERAGPSQREAELLLNAFKHLERGLKDRL